MENPRAKHVSLAYLLAGLAATAAYFALPSAASQNVAYDAIGLSAVAAMLYGVWYHRPANRLPWYLLALCGGLSVVGDMLWTYDENIRGVVTPFPSVSDIFYLASYVAFFVGVMRLVRTQGAGDDRAAAIDTAIVAVGAGAILWAFLVDPQWDNTARPLLARVIAGVYPAMGLLILAAATRLALGLERWTVALRLLILAMACTFVANVAYAHLMARGAYQTGHPIDAGWLLAYILHGTLVLHPSMRARLAPTTRRDTGALPGLLLLALAALIGPALLEIRSLSGVEVGVPMVVGTSTALVLLAVARLRLLAEALRRREARFRALVQHAADGVAVTSADGITTYLSPAVAAIIGYSPDELVGRDIFARVHPDDLDEAQRLFVALLEEPGGTSTVQVRAQHADGRWRDLEVHGTNLLREPAVGGIVLNYRDITERVRTQQAQQYLAWASEQLSASLDFDTTLNAVASLLVPAFGDWCIIDLRNEDGTLERAIVYHADPALAPAARELQGRRLDPERQIVSAPIVRSQYDPPGDADPSDLAADIADGPGRIASYRALGIGAYVTTPLQNGVRTLGQLTVVSADPVRRNDARALATIQELARRAALALDNTSLHRALAAREYELQDLVGRLLQQQEEERRRVAYDIHDGLAQLAASINLHLQAFNYRHQPRLPEVQQDLDQILAVSQQTVQEARRIIAALRPIALDDLGLGTALHRQVEHLRSQGWTIAYRDGLEGKRLPPALETALYRVTQEALNNIRKHASTTEATIVLERAGEVINLRVRDEGIGFLPHRAADGEEPGERIGLRGMRERITLLGGIFSVSSQVGGGTEVHASVPLRSPRA